jgi:hypothetical protein
VVPIAIVHRLELATIDRDARCRKQTDLPAELDEACAHLANGMTADLPEVRNRLVIGDQAAEERGLAHRRSSSGQMPASPIIARA